MPAPRLSTSFDELPWVVNVGCPVARLLSQAAPVSGSLTAFTQPAVGVRHQVTLVSTPAEVFAGGGVAGKTAHFGLSESKSTWSSRTSTAPVIPST